MARLWVPWLSTPQLSLAGLANFSTVLAAVADCSSRFGRELRCLTFAATLFANELGTAFAVNGPLT
jgi:hypothetical protein